MEEEKEFNEAYHQWFNKVYMKKFPDLIDTAQYFYELGKKNKNMKVYSYVLRSASGDYYHTITTKDYKDVYDYMKNEVNGEYEAWKSEWDDDWDEFDEKTIDYAYYVKKEITI